MSGRLTRWAGDLRTLPRDALFAYRRGGWGDLRETLTSVSLQRVCRYGRLLIVAQALDSFRAVSPPPGVHLSQLAPADWPALAGLVTQRQLKGFARRLADGMIGLIAWRGTRAIGYTWLTERLHPGVIPCPILLPSTAAYLFDLYVTPGERSAGIGSALASGRLALARARGFDEGWRMIAPTNRPSLRTMEKTTGSGTRVVGHVRYVKVLAKVYSWRA